MTRAARAGVVTGLLLGITSVVGVSAGSAQTLLTIEEAMKRAQGETVDARALASTIDEANARVERAQAGFWPRVDVTETVQRGNHPVFAFSSLLSQRRFTAADFAIASLNHARRAGLCRWSLSFWWGTGSATWADDRTTPAERIPAVNARQADRWAFLSIETERITVGR